MGLDMYLTRKKYIGGNYDFRNVKGELNITINGVKIPLDIKKITYIEEDIGYWRKANQIHNWFVKNIQDCVDDCKSYYVSIEDLEKLLNICKKVKNSIVLIDKKIILENGKEYDTKIIKDSTLAEELLPCQSGFFFGSTEYDEYYLQDIENTIEIIENLLKEEDLLNNLGFYSEFEYRASW